MNRHNTRQSVSTSGLILAIFIATILLGGIWIGCQTLQRNAPTAATQPADLVSDDRIIFAGIPRSTRPESQFTLLKNTAYMVGYSEARKDPLWSAYRVVHMDHPNNLPRPKIKFMTDTRTAAHVNDHDFTNSGYDRGHMTPNSAIARCYGHDAQLETFLLSNICPQSKPLNEKVWEALETEEFTYADRFDEVWIIDGPIFSDLNNGETRTLPAGIAVPTAFYKILIEDKDNHPQAFAVIMPQSVKGTELPSQFTVPLSEIEKETGLEFLWKLDPNVRQKLESEVHQPW